MSSPTGPDDDVLLLEDDLLVSRSSSQQLLFMTPASGSRDAATRLEHFYSLRHELDPQWAVRPTELRYSGGMPTLVATDPGGQPLTHLLHQPLGLPAFLDLSIGIGSALASLHARGLIHLDIKPASILAAPTGGAAWLTALGRASRARAHRQAPAPPHVIAGTLAYMAPEQTGRMNRSIDSRSDLYSFGMLLYQMLVGEVPFAALDPMELVHCHVARRPTPPHERSGHVPPAVSGVVMKLLAKVAEDRYQTAAGAVADLRSCRTDLQEQGRVRSFPLGERDASERLSIPERLYGRTRDIQELRAAFERVVASGRPELVLVSGFSGVGKSSVVGELYKELLATRGLFASGKFDQYNRDIPYATLAQAFQRLVHIILVEPEAELERYRDALRRALDPYAQLVINLVPDLERVIGEQPKPPDLGPQDAQRILKDVLLRFIGVFARAEHPLALFLDDLQWLDAATLDLLQHLLLSEHARFLLLVGAYRDNEVGPDHPLARRVDAMRGAGAPIKKVELLPLALSDVTRLIADTLHDDQVLPLAELVHDKTQGNPFFTIQFLTALADDGLIAFDAGARRWVWDLPSIAARGFTDNVVVLMIERITRLAEPCCAAMQVMACIGNTAYAQTLAAALETTEASVHVALRDALAAGLLARQGAVYTFLHDRVQEASYALIPESERPITHLRVGRRLVAHTPLDELDENVFEIVGQLNRGVELVKAREELDRIAELNIKAGKRAKAATAYVTALAFFRTGALLLGDEGFARRRRLAFTLDLERGECEFLTGELDQAEPRLAALAAHADGPVELAAVACQRMALYFFRGEAARAVAVCVEYLERDGSRFNPHPSREDVDAELERLWAALGSRSVEQLVELPETTDAATLATVEVLCIVAGPSWFFDPLLPGLIAARIVRLSIERGNSPGSSFGYAIFGTKLGSITGDYHTAHRFGLLAVELAERSAGLRTLGHVLNAYGMFVRPWAHGLDGCRAIMNRSFELSARAGDLTYSAYTLLILVTLTLFDGSPLAEAEAACERSLDYARKHSFQFNVLCSTGQTGLLRTLRGGAGRFGSFDDAQFHEGEFERQYGGAPELTFPMSWYWVYRQQATFLAGDAAGSLAAALAAEPLLWVSREFLEFAEHHFYAALARASYVSIAEAAARPKLREALGENLKMLSTFGDSSPGAFGSRATLVEAEVARVDGREREAMDLYEKAIRAASTAGFVHIEALAFELAARFYDARGFHLIALTYRREARFGYQRWGAHAKVRQLEQLFPELRERTVVGGTIDAPVELLDLTTVLKVSQAVSSEIMMPRLVDILMRTAIEHAGATRGLLVLPWRDQLRVEAEASASGEAVGVRLRDGELAPSADMPESIVRYVLRTRTSVIIDDAANESRFPAEPYFASRRPRALLCLPLVNQASATGVLYLENELAPQTFTPTRVAVLKLLASQAAVSMENTRLYANLEEREAKIRRLVEANVIGIFIWSADGSIHDANDAFLGMLGYDRQELSAERPRWTDLVAPAWQARVREAAAELERTGSAKPYEVEYLRRDGSLLPVLAGAAAFEGGVGDGVAFVLDLSEQKRVEQRLRRSEAYLAEAQRLTHTGSWSYDLAREELGHCSEELTRLFGFDAAAPQPPLHQLRRRVHAGDRARAVHTMLRAITAGQDFEADFRILIPGESEPKYIHCLGHPVFDASRQLTGFVGTLVDVTERRRANDERERLRQAQSDLAHVTRVTTLGELAGSLAHEVKQPLAGAVMNASACLRWLTREVPDLERGSLAASLMSRDVNRAADIVGRIESMFKKRALPHEPVGLRELIEQMIEILRSEATRYSVVIRTELTEQLPLVMADRVQIQQVILNLVVNAIEAMKDSAGPRGVLVVAQPRGQHVHVSVRDTGKGFPEPETSKLFEAFFTTKREGTGMGLSISRSIVEAHGGRISAQNNADCGATFEFTLPTLPTNDQSDDHAARDARSQP